jgi:hypothetical protein
VKFLSHFPIVIALALVLSLSIRMPAQPTPYVVGSTVTGTVFCADTSAPARFAKVVLKSIEPSHAGEDFMKNLQENLQKMAAKDGEGSEPVGPPSDDKRKALSAAAKSMDQAMDMLGASTVGLDGKFSFAGVKPGTYYVHAIYEGYMDPFSQFSDDDFTSTDPSVRARRAQIPTVTVSGTDSAHAEIRLDRGASVSGRIVYDDGSPASGWTVSVVHKKELDLGSELAATAMNPALALSGAASLFKTDDLGHYRVSGITAGEYLVSATLSTPPIGINATNIMDGGGTINLTVYSGDTFSRTGAKSIVISTGEERAGVDMTIPARSLHSIVGHVYAKSDGHTLNIGQVTLTSKDNPALHRSAAIRDDGSFHFEYLPGGSTYTVKVVDAAEGKNIPGATSFMGMKIPKQEIMHKYGSDTTDVMLGAADVNTVRLNVAQTVWSPPVKKPGNTDITPADLLQGVLGAIPSGTNQSNDAPKP